MLQSITKRWLCGCGLILAYAVILQRAVAREGIAQASPHRRTTSRPAKAGLAATPPMGFNPWNAFRTEFDEAKLLHIADAMVDRGLVSSGYRYMNIDDGWWLKRDATGVLQIRTSMFPSAHISDTETSFRPFINQLHSRGLKAGIYTDIGRNACSQHWDPSSSHLPAGSLPEREVGLHDHEQQDARLFFKLWGFDYIKVDACGFADYGPQETNVRSGEYASLGPWINRQHPQLSDPERVARLYAHFAKTAKNESLTPPVLEICAWGEAGVNDWAHQFANLWRTSSDIQPSWQSMLANFDAAAPRALFAGPGHWNDPDMLEVGNGDFDQNHLVEAQAHMSLWAIIAAPLILSYDLTTSPRELLEIVRNPEMIAIDQDIAGNQGIILSKTDSTEIVYRSLAARGSKAVAFINRGIDPVTLSIPLIDLHLDGSAATQVRDIWRRQDRSVHNDLLEVHLGAHETSLLRVNGRPDDPNTFFIADMPAVVTVITNGTRPQALLGAKDWVPAQIGSLPSGKSLEDDGNESADTIAVAPGTRLRIDLGSRYKRFLCQSAVDVPSANLTSSSYSIYGDGKLLLKESSGKSHSVAVSVRGIRSLELIAPEGNASSTWAFLWKHARLTR